MKGRGGVAGGDVDGDASTARVVGRDDGTFGGREHAMGCIGDGSCPSLIRSI